MNDAMGNMIEDYILTCPKCHHTTLMREPFILFCREIDKTLECLYCGKVSHHVPYCTYLGSLESFDEFDRFTKTYLDA